MKKRTALSALVLTIIVLSAISIGFTQAYFTDKATAAGADASAGYFEVSVDLVLANYGVPSDTLLTSFGSTAEPAESTVTITNKGSTAMDYTLSLTVNKETAFLLNANGFELRNAENEPLKFMGNPSSDEDGNLTYIFKSDSANALKNGESDVYSLALTFKGEELLDGNDYQGAEISVTAVVEAIQAGGAEL